MIGNRGQGAMEYLMTYGWAILVVMVVGIAMWQLGIFNMGGTTVTSTGFPKIKPQLAATGLETGGLFKGTFTNGVGTKIYINEITVDWPNAGTPCTGSVDEACGGLPNCIPAGEYTTGINGYDVGAGENFLAQIQNCLTGDSGEVYSVDVAIAYTVQIGSQTVDHTDRGSIRGPFE